MHIYIKKYNATDTIKLRDIDIYILINKHEIIINDNNLLFVLIFLNSINAVIPNKKNKAAISTRILSDPSSTKYITEARVFIHLSSSKQITL
ncbi:Uncharacterised protein [Klebsiella variicola]|uniref:Uncharacterized protein n=1 Tax=Klebsiella variicola TaxID=244366 RepID=A0A7H4MNM9_KLEVA|nr:Uncharacterised protein [Klebsiella variicola]